MAVARVILVSDTHLSARAPQAQANWDAVVSFVGAAAPDLVIHLGDLSLDGTRDARDLRYGRRQLDRLPVAWHAVPGNHDIGDNPWPGAPGDITVDAGRHQRWLDIVGADHWSVTAGGWVLLAVNAQLLGSGLPAEAAQWSWLEEQAGQHRGGQPVTLITHKPVTATGTELAAAPPYRFWPEPHQNTAHGEPGDLGEQYGRHRHGGAENVPVAIQDFRVDGSPRGKEQRADHRDREQQHDQDRQWHTRQHHEGHQAPLARSEPIITRRRGSRSASPDSATPPMNSGTTLAANVTAASSADRVRSYTSTVSATRASWSPVTDNTWASHNARNSATPNT